MLDSSLKNRLGRCFELNYKFVVDNQEWSLVHGYITDIRGKQPVTVHHAWSKKGNLIYDAVLDAEMDYKVYYHFYRHEERYVYTAMEAIEISMRDRTYGNWEEL